MEFNARDFAAARGIETNGDKHAAKWERHASKKDALINEAWTVSCKAPRKQTIGVGERATEKSGRKQVGVVVGDDWGDSSSPKWSIKFDNEEEIEENMPLSGLKLARAEREFTWTTIKDSAPDNPVV